LLEGSEETPGLSKFRNLCVALLEKAKIVAMHSLQTGKGGKLGPGRHQNPKWKAKFPLKFNNFHQV
jgi:hypothetical protein